MKRFFALCAVLTGFMGGCAHEAPQGTNPEAIPEVPVTAIPGHDGLAQDNSIKEGPRLMPAETYIRSYLQLFGGLSPLDAQTAARGKDLALFDRWTDYLAALGLPDYKVDIGRATQTNALMVATFERVGIALCDRAVENDLRGGPLKKVVFTFDAPATLDLAAFTTRFDAMHRTFLGYPAELAPTDRTKRFFDLYTDAVSKQAKGLKLSPTEAGWAAVCYGLIRHPEFHLY
ncbi:MAG: hypothetical protein ACXVEE_25675 [Polyangiales bacterium]